MIFISDQNLAPPLSLNQERNPEPTVPQTLRNYPLLVGYLIPAGMIAKAW